MGLKGKIYILDVEEYVCGQVVVVVSFESIRSQSLFIGHIGIFCDPDASSAHGISGSTCFSGAPFSFFHSHPH